MVVPSGGFERFICFQLSLIRTRLQIDAVVHHGGAGTTAAGLKAGRPTMVVPFFGDQPFWGSMVHRMGVGAAPIPFKKLTAQNLADSLLVLIKPEVRVKAEELGVRMCEETGVLNACRSIHRHLPLAQMTCDIFPERLATHFVDLSRTSRITVCHQAMQVLIEQNVVPRRKWKRRQGGFVKWNLDDVPSNSESPLRLEGRPETDFDLFSLKF